MKCLEQANPQRWKVNISDHQRLQGSRSGERGVTANEHGVSFWGDRNVLELYSSDGCTTL